LLRARWRGPERIHFPELYEGLSGWNMLLGAGGAALRVELHDTTGALVTSGAAANALLHVVLLQGAASAGRPLAPHVVHKTGKGGREERLLECGAAYRLVNGVCILSGLRVKTNSSGAANNEFRLGCALGGGAATAAEGRVVEAVSRAFRVKARRAEAIRKHHPREILLDSEVWRLVHIKRDSRKVTQLRSLLGGRISEAELARGPWVGHLVQHFSEGQWPALLGIADEQWVGEVLDHIKQARDNSAEKARCDAMRCLAANGGAAGSALGSALVGHGEADEEEEEDEDGAGAGGGDDDEGGGGAGARIGGLALVRSHAGGNGNGNGNGGDGVPVGEPFPFHLGRSDTAAGEMLAPVGSVLLAVSSTTGNVSSASAAAAAAAAAHADASAFGRYRTPSALMPAELMAQHMSAATGHHGGHGGYAFARESSRQSSLGLGLDLHFGREISWGVDASALMPDAAAAAAAASAAGVSLALHGHGAHAHAHAHAHGSLLASGGGGGGGGGGGSAMPNGLRQLSAAAEHAQATPVGPAAPPAPALMAASPSLGVMASGGAGAGAGASAGAGAPPMSGLVSQLLGHQSGTSTMLELQDRSRELARSMSRPEDGSGNPAAQEELSTLLVLGSIAMASLMRSNTADSTNTGGAAVAAADGAADASALQATPQAAEAAAQDAS
jgi:hypothetical protein